MLTANRHLCLLVYIGPMICKCFYAAVPIMFVIYIYTHFPGDRSEPAKCLQSGTALDTFIFCQRILPSLTLYSCCG